MSDIGVTGSNRSHRGEAVVSDVLAAAREELARVGYRALRIEDVATRANVNRTTIYRRWPSKVELVGDTLRVMFDHPVADPDTGSLRGDLLVVAASMLRFLTSANGQVLVRMVMAEGTEPELRGLVDAMRGEKNALAERIIERARARGEICPAVRHEIFVSNLIGGLHHRVFVLGVGADAIDLEEHVDLLLYGAAGRSR